MLRSRDPQGDGRSALLLPGFLAGVYTLGTMALWLGIAKTRELRLGLVSRGPNERRALDPDKFERYWVCLKLLERRLGDHPLARQLRFEPEALAVLPPR